MVSSPQNEGLGRWAGHAALTGNRTSYRIVGGKCGTEIKWNTMQWGDGRGQDTMRLGTGNSNYGLHKS